MTFYFEDFYLKDNKQVIIVIEIDEDLGMPKVKVDLGSITLNLEVAVEFSILNFDNNKTFYTDSNGLEM